MTNKQKQRPEDSRTTRPSGPRKPGQGHVSDEHLRKDRGGQIGSGDAREQADQEEFDRGGHRLGRSRDQAH